MNHNSPNRRLIEGLSPTVLPTGSGRELSITKTGEASMRQSDGAVMSLWQQRKRNHIKGFGQTYRSCITAPPTVF